MTNVYTIYDIKIGRYFNPFNAKTDIDAVRVVAPMMGVEGSNFKDFPEDFHIVKLGEYDENLGKHINYETIITISTMVALKQRVNSQEQPETFDERVEEGEKKNGTKN